MKLERLQLRKIHLPLSNPFITHQSTVNNRTLMIIEAIDEDGNRGYGEVTAFDTPFYTYETITTAWHILIDVIIPSLPWKDIQHPTDSADVMNSYQGHPMAKAGLEGALWDLYSKQRNKSLSEVIGGVRKYVEAGAVISLSATLEKDIARLKKMGYQRFKLKVEKGEENELIESVQKFDPYLPIMIDANGQYTEKDLDHLQQLDSYHLMMIEQPFQSGDFYLHSTLQANMDTPICLDESVVGFHDAKQAIQLNSCKIINIKISRVGGLTAAIQIHDYCKQAKIPVWCGGMVESGISKAHNLALSSLDNFIIPGDLSSSTRYFERDIIKPGIEVRHGHIKVPTEPGIGVEVDRAFLEEVTFQQEEFVIQN